MVFAGGFLSIEYYYTNGSINGPAKSFYSGGKVQSEGNYKNDNEDGEWKEYTKEGLLLRKIIYKDGKVIKEIAGGK